MASITVEGGPSNWREAFLAHPGLAVTAENHDRLLADAEPAPEPAPEAAEPAPEPPAELPVADSPPPRVPPRRTPPGDAEG